MLALLVASTLVVAAADGEKAKSADDYVLDGASIGATILDVRKVHPGVKLAKGSSILRVKGENGRYTDLVFGGRPVKVTSISCDYAGTEQIAKLGGLDGAIKAVTELAGDPTHVDGTTESATWIGEKQTIVVRYAKVRVGGRKTLTGETIDPGTLTPYVYINVTPTKKEADKTKPKKKS
jgi:hypothetical protein